LEVKLRQGILPDFLWVPNSFAVRGQVLEIMTSAGLTGFTAEPIIVTNKPGRAKLLKAGEEYFHLFITSVPSLNCRKSGVKLLYECKVCGARRFSSWGGLFGRPWVLDEATYDGSDFFRLAQHDGPVYCTEKVAALIQQHRWSNVCMLDYRLAPPPTLYDLSYGMFSFTRWKFRK
jgi:hypothetical protein